MNQKIVSNSAESVHFERTYLSWSGSSDSESYSRRLFDFVLNMYRTYTFFFILESCILREIHRSDS